MNPSPSTSHEHELNDFAPDAKLILYADPEKRKLMKYHTSKLKPVTDLGTLELCELITQPWFQDNTLLFDKLLKNKKRFVMCIYPPGSGKSTIAELLKYYLSTNGIPEEVRTFLNACQFQKTEDTCAHKFRGSSSFVLFMDFNRVRGNTRLELEITYAEYMLHCWKICGLPDVIANSEKKLLQTDASCVWFSLLRLHNRIINFFNGNLYVILDSLDNMYNLIANLPVTESEELYADFTENVAMIIGKNEPRIKAFIFGVSPYLIYEFEKYAISYYYVGSEENSVGQYFSYSNASIQRVINEWKLNVSLDECKSVSKFQYNSNSFVNPYLCVSYLRSLKENGALFRLNLSPHSLWMKFISKEEDLNFLYEVLSGESKQKFAMAMSIRTMYTLSKVSKNRKLYFPLFIFGGFLSCKEEMDEDDTYNLSTSNESTKILLYHHLEILNFTRFKVGVSECQSLFNEYLNGNFRLYCKNLSLCLRTMSSYLIKEERPYHTYMAGIIAPLILSGYKIVHDKEYGLIKPDCFIKKDNRIILHEFKHVIPPDFIPKKARITVQDLEGTARCEKLEDFYTDLEKVAKSEIVKSCREVVSKARLCQLSRYAPDFSSQFQQDVEVNIMLFYINHVILLHCTYSYSTTSFSKYEIFASDGYFNDNDLKLIQNAK